MQYIGALQKKHNCGSFELLSKTAPIQAASLILIGPFLDYFLIGQNVLKYTYSTGAIVSYSLCINRRGNGVFLCGTYLRRISSGIFVSRTHLVFFLGCMPRR